MKMHACAVPRAIVPKFTKKHCTQTPAQESCVHIRNAPRVDADALKERLPDYLTAIGHPPVFHSGATSLKALCPLHLDRKPSLKANLRSGTWVWFCHPCGKGGTLIDLHAAHACLSVKTHFKTICEEIASLLGHESRMVLEPVSRRVQVPAAEKVSKAIEPEELERQTSPWRSRLYQDDILREAFARELQLSPETLRNLTTPSLDALGITPPDLSLRKADGTICRLQAPRLAYIFDGGYKIRDPFATGRPRFWQVGDLRRPWGSYWLCRRAPFISDVHLVESESTAIALIEAGFNDPFHEGTCVVATSGSNGFDPRWVPLFTDRTIHFWPDRDPAGERFFEETARVLYGSTKRIVRHHF